MLYALKDETGTVIAVSEKPVSTDWLKVNPEDDGVKDFLKRQPALGNKLLKGTDLDFIRVLDDLIELLIDRQVIQFTELPEPAQQKLLNRRWYRQQLKGGDDTTHLIDPQEGLI